MKTGVRWSYINFYPSRKKCITYKRLRKPKKKYLLKISKKIVRVEYMLRNKC